MLKVEIYVDGTRLDLFKDENISITDTIQDIRDPGTIFTAFSQTFTVPASKTNNKVFNHYYNSKVVNGVTGFDARFTVPAVIRVNGFDYKTGTIRLQSTSLKTGKAYSYTVSFIGDGALVRDALLDADLSSLTDLDQYNHDYSLANAKTGLQYGLGLSGGSMTQSNGTTIDRSIIYPFISHTKRYVYDSTMTAGGEYVTYNSAVTAGTEGLEYNQLKPALKCIHIIEAIENSSLYDITFTRDFFGDDEFDDLYMWLNRTKGFIEGVDNNISTIETTEWVDPPTSGTDVVERDAGGGIYVIPYQYSPEGSGPLRTFQASFDTTITGGGQYNFEVYDTTTGDLLHSSKGQSGDQTFVVQLEAPLGGGKVYRPRVVITSEGTITAIDVELSMERSVYSPGANYTPTVDTGVYDIPTITPNNYATISLLIPKMTIMDFLRGIFKMFNLTHYKKSNGDVYVDTLDNFYALGTELDITEYIDVSDSTSDVTVPFDYVGFKHTEPKTFLSKNRFEILNDVFGNEEYSIGTLWCGSKYEITTGFSHMMFEHLPDLGTGESLEPTSNNLFGWAVDEDENPISDTPLLMYLRGTQTLADIEWSDGAVITSYQSLGNTNSTTGGGKSLNFGVEVDEFTLGQNTNSLYSNYYQDYIGEVYGGSARLVKYTAYLPASFILNYNMYDKLIVNGVKHKINSITIDLLDGKSQLELITEA